LLREHLGPVLSPNEVDAQPLIRVLRKVEAAEHGCATERY